MNFEFCSFGEWDWKYIPDFFFLLLAIGRKEWVIFTLLLG